MLSTLVKYVVDLENQHMDIIEKENKNGRCGEMVAALDCGSSVYDMWVQVPSSTPMHS